MSNQNDVCMHGIQMGEFCQECKNLSDIDQMDSSIDRAYRNGFRAGWNAGINGDEDLLRQVNERPNK